MIDFYGLGQGFPGIPLPSNLDNLQRVEYIERAVKEDICARIPEFRPDKRLIPYISLHEYEALLFSDTLAFAAGIERPDLAIQLQAVRSSFPTPEDINDNVETAPSKQVIRIHGTYKKVIEGTMAARAVGIEKMRAECAHFRAWLETLETLRD
jgi:hypothetical protein